MLVYTACNMLITNAVDSVSTLLNVEIRYLPNGFSCQIYVIWILWSLFFIALQAPKPTRRAVGISKYTSPAEAYVIFYDTSRTVGGWQAKRNSLEISSRRRLSWYRRWSSRAIHFRYTLKRLKHLCHTIQYFLSSCQMLLRLISEATVFQYCVK